MSVANATVLVTVATGEVTRRSARNSCSPTPRRKRPFQSIDWSPGWSWPEKTWPTARFPRRIVSVARAGLSSVKLKRVVSSRPSLFGEKTCGETWNPAVVRSTITASVAVVSIPIAFRAVSTIP